MTPPSGPFHIVINPGSGAGEGERKRDALVAVLGDSGRRFEFEPVDTPRMLETAMRQAARRAREAQGVLVAVGGDGTLTTGAQAALDQGCPLGVVPQGTFNYFAREYGIPQDLEAAARALLTARLQPVQAARVNGRVFLVNASLGMYPQLLIDREAFTERFGRRRWVAALSALVTLFKWRHQLHLDFEADGEHWTLRTPTLFVGNNRVQLQRLGMAEGLVEPVGRGRVAAVFPHPIGTRAMLGLVLRGAFGRLGEADQVDSFTFQRLTVRLRGRRRSLVAADGEIGTMAPPLTFEVCPEPLMLLMPREEERVAPG